jgi:two-component system response regulator
MCAKMAAVEKLPITILIAEDDANDVLLLKRAFEKARLRASLFFVPNGEDVIRYLQGQPPFENRAAHPFPDLLLLDLNMPGLGGLAVLEWLVANPAKNTMPAVIFSSCVHPEESRHATHLGARSCITKPLNPMDLVPLLRDLPAGKEMFVD